METLVLVMYMSRPYSVSKYVRNSWRVMSPTFMSRLSHMVHVYSLPLTVAAVAAGGEGLLNGIKGTARLTKPFF